LEEPMQKKLKEFLDKPNTPMILEQIYAPDKSKLTHVSSELEDFHFVETRDLNEFVAQMTDA
jgi:hypothetical protein